MTRTFALNVRSLLFAGCALLLMSSSVSALDRDGLDALYQAVEDAVSRYQGGLEEIRNGELGSGHARIRDAVADLGMAGDACAQKPGCETQRFMAAYHELLTLRSAMLMGTDEDLVDVEPEEVREPEPIFEYDEDPADPRVDVGLGSDWFDGTGLSETIEYNSLVRGALNDWLTWKRPTLVDAYENYMHMRHLMWPYYEEAGIPEGLLFGILAKESGGRVHSVSRAGAAGPLQFMFYTGLRFGLTTEDGFDQRFDPAESARASVGYLRARFAEHDGDLALALAAYNGGETRVLRLAREASVASFWNPEIFRRLPRETQEYVPYVLAAALLFERPEDYGVEFPAVNTAPGQIDLQAPITLSELGVCLGQGDSRSGWFRALRNLNPRHEHDVPLPAGSTVWLPAPVASAYAENCVDGPLLELAEALHDAREQRRILLAVRTYTVRSGDTLSSIVAAKGCPSVRIIAEANGIAGPRYLIRPGQQLKLTGCRI
ncbi:transglycosylase SLT domain-containing protein [Thioalkalivibrio sp.]|uniref:transglycosylase SLT domain-containing protein n=1 Tax=Thioalkalivibrio sp. TaxID=2093813 RepID=UPI0012D62935|nr:transglycosylase SLT domain-containing protein [Thioalkalivibrio sp.]TVP79541.1 MAG: LysM peptidoglycan-binding domain-containing protein [Thioalkalivibrio sp.]